MVEEYLVEGYYFKGTNTIMKRVNLMANQGKD